MLPQEILAGLGALERIGFGAFQIGDIKYVTTQDPGRLGSLLIQPTSADKGMASAIGYFPKNGQVKVSGMTVGGSTRVVGQAYTMDDKPAGELEGWVANQYLSDIQGGAPWVPSGQQQQDQVPNPPSIDNQQTLDTSNVSYEPGGGKKTNYTPWIVGGVLAAAAIGIGVVALTGKRKKARHARA